MIVEILFEDAELDQRPYKRIHQLLRSRGPIAPTIISTTLLLIWFI